MSTPRPQPESLLLSFRETCEALRVSASTGERLIRKAAFPTPLRIGVQRFHRPEDVKAWLAAKAEKAF